MEKPNQKTGIYLNLPKRNKGNVLQKFRKVVIESNRFKVDVSKLSCLSIFAMKFINDEGIQKPGQKEQIIAEIVPIIKKYIHEPIIKDGLIFTLKPSDNTSDMTIQHKNYLIVIREVKRFNTQKNPEMLLYFLSNILRKVMQKLNYIEIGNTRKFINMNTKKEIQNVIVYSGFKVNFELLENGYFLTVDTTKKVVRNQNVLQYINYLYQTNESLQRSQKRQLVRKCLLNKIIMTNYGKTRYLKIQDVLFIDLSLIIVQNCKMPLPQYYKLRYDYQIKNFKQPLLSANCKNSKYKTYLIPQLCLMTGVPDDFDEIKNKALADQSKVTVDIRKSQIQSFIQNLHNQQDKIFPVLGVQISPKCEKIQAKMIPLPKIMFGQGKSVPTGRQSNFNFQDVPLYNAKAKTKLGIITFDGIDSNTIVDYFDRTFKSIKLKIEICNIKTDNSKLTRGIQFIKSFIEMAKQKQNCNLCMLVLPNKMKHLYQKIKELAMLQQQLCCQVVLQKTLKNKNIHSVSLKIMIQVLAKAGNIIWASIPQSKKSKIMLIAYYSCQLAKSKVNSYTIGICATCDDLQTQIFSKTSKYIKEHEQLQSMKQLFFEALSAYIKRNGHAPQDIVIIQNKKPPRTQESTISFFVEPAINTMQEYYGLKRPKIIYILITKTLNHRFYRTFQGKCINPPLGTLINGQVTTANKFNFYMVAHSTCKNGGSIIPLNYEVIFSDSDIQQGVLQSLLFSQCFSYVNFTGAIKQPSVLQYAIKCAKFGAEVLCNLEVPDKFKLYPYYI